MDDTTRHPCDACHAPQAQARIILIPSMGVLYACGHCERVMAAGMDHCGFDYAIEYAVQTVSA